MEYLQIKKLLITLNRSLGPFCHVKGRRLRYQQVAVDYLLAFVQGHELTIKDRCIRD